MNSQHRTLIRSLCIALALTVIVTACPDPVRDRATVDTTAMQGRKADSCVAVRAHDSEIREESVSVDGLCQALVRSGVADDERLQVSSCDDSIMPEIRTEDSGLLMTAHSTFRLHPVDAFEKVTTPNRTDHLLGDLEVEDDQHRLVIVIDGRDHGHHVAGVAASLLGINHYIHRTLDDLRNPDAPWVRMAGPQVIYVEVPTTGDDPFMFVSEVDAAATLDAVRQRLHEDHATSRVVINMSFGGYSCEPPARLLDAIIAFRSIDDRVLFTASAGNDEVEELPYPAQFAMAEDGREQIVFSVGSIDAMGNRSCFSNFGHVSYWAPGEEVYVGDIYVEKLRDLYVDDRRGTWSGTSFAAPQLAAMLAAEQTGARSLAAPGPALEAGSLCDVQASLRGDEPGLNSINSQRVDRRV